MLTEKNMIPAGYLAKHIGSRPDWLKVPHVQNIYSVSCCMTEDFADYTNFWRHNGFWLFDSSDIIHEIAKAHSIDISNTTMFYYESYEDEYDERAMKWVKFRPDENFPVSVRVPDDRILQGFDIVPYSMHTSPECSPLSCNALAETVEVNAHCLLNSLEVAKCLLEENDASRFEPGPYRIFSVYTV